MKLRLASYNLRKCLGTDRRRDPGRSVDVLNAVGADVVALQEVDHRLGARPAALARDLVESATDLKPLDFAVSDVSLGWHGQTLLVRRGTEATDTERLDLPGLEPRGAVLAELRFPDGAALRVIGVHLGLVRKSRQAQMHRIRAAVDRRHPMPTVIMGDFNEWSPKRGLDPLAEAYQIHAPGRSFHASRPIAALDRVALGKGVALTDAGVHETAVSRRASDHLPIWADIAVNAA